MFRVIPLRISLWRAGWVLLALSLIPTYVGAATFHLTAPGIALAPPWDGRAWAAFAIVYTVVLVCGWLGAREIWLKWRQRGLAQPVEVAELPATYVRWTWPMMQLFGGVLFLVVGIWLAGKVAWTVDDEFGLLLGVALALGWRGMSYLLLARRVGKLEQERGVVYYWQRQPGIENFQHVGVCIVPVHAVLR